ncbi:hypothetical protein [Streptomyces sp. I05A-00742]|uniref:hypothetical protein n=1 Tax=Streptomyces sp. I05A-00742 TaxID=2732853 RepID=UPI0014876B82|nr:hypothetical protein [Streptomyces sp. I05A-00742]
MSVRKRSYRYVGPDELRAAIRPGGVGSPIGRAADLDSWIAEQSAVELDEPFTFVADTDGLLRPAPRRSEHVACAGGAPVLSAGEISFVREAGRWAVGDVTNHSTGYCPDVASWRAVAHALDRAGLGHPSGFTHEVVFRRCPGCRERGIVREDDFVCVFCGGDLPQVWNLDPAG